MVRPNDRFESVRTAFLERKAFGQIAIGEVEAAIARLDGNRTQTKLAAAESAKDALDALNDAIERRRAAKIAGDNATAATVTAEINALRESLLTKLRSI
jgi:hypothetical protein